MKKLLFILSIVFVMSNCVLSATLFTENFESDLSKWTGPNYGAHHGVIVSDPLRANNKVLSFNGLGNGGDIFNTTGIELVLGKTYEISFEYLGLEIPGVSVYDNYGGFFGLNDIVGNSYTLKAWLFGTEADHPELRGHLIDYGQWHTYTYAFEWQRSEIDASDDIVHLMMEDWISSGGTYGDVFFDNITFVEVIPEPASISLLAIGGLSLLRKRK